MRVPADRARTQRGDHPIASPPPWPGRPSAARSAGRFWYIESLPPDPYPTDGYDYGDDPRYGPPGTRWLFTYQQLFDHALLPGTSSAAKAAIARLLRKFGTVRPPDVWTTFTTPLALADPAQAVEQELGMPMHWIRTQVVGAIGADEEVVHVFNWRHSTTENAPIDAAALKAFSNTVRDRWGVFCSATRANYPATLNYTEVRTSLLIQDAPAARPTFTGSTQISPFGAGGGTTGTGAGEPLPYEVALGVSFNTNFRGTARFRGRVYLGPLDPVVMGSEGQFDTSVVRPIAATLGSAFVAGVDAASDYELHVVSQLYGTSAKVTGVRVGATPDSQRRRRRDRPENYFQAWGTPVGAV